MHIIKGHYRAESGDLEAGTLFVDAAGGAFREAETGAPLVAASYAVADGIRGIEITSPQAAWQFVPDAGEAERIGMPVA